MVFITLATQTPPKEKAIEMTKKGQLENVHVVTRTDGSQHLRTNPDSKTKNNLDEMAQD